MLMLALFVATTVPLLALVAVYRLDRYSTGTFRIALVCFAWGIVATRVALLLNTAALDSGRLDAGTVARVAAPAVEELVKALLIVYLVRRPSFTYFVDSAIYGFAIGIGFAVVENYHYLLNHQDVALSLAVGRVLSTNLMHASATAVAGVALGLAHFERNRLRRLAIGSGGLGAAIGMHMVFNSLVTRFVGSTLALYVIAAAYGLAGAVAVALVIRFGLRRASGWIEATLGASDQVTAGETSAVEQIGDLSALLRPIAERFGQQKADEVRALLQLQARLGILLRNADELPDGAAKRQATAEIERVQHEMDARRTAIGVYCMLYVRVIDPDAAGRLWPKLGSLNAAPAADDMWHRLAAQTRPEHAVKRRLRAPELRRRVTLGIFGFLTIALWLLPWQFGAAPWLAPQARLLLQIAGQWLLAVGLLASLARSDPDLWRRLDQVLDERTNRAGLGRRMLAKGVRLTALVAALALTVAIWTAPRWLASTPWDNPPAMAQIQALAQVAVVVSVATLFGRLGVAYWSVTMVAVVLASAVLLASAAPL